MTLALVVAAALAAARLLGGCWPQRLGGFGPALAPGLLLSFWLAGVWAGQAAGSLAGMAAGGALPLLALAVPRLREPWRRPGAPRWSAADWLAFAFIAALLFSFNGNDVLCHFAVIGQYLRGNVPPTQLNDPGRALAYHAAFDAAAAVLARAFGLGPQAAIDVFSGLCVAASFCALQAVSRALFRGASVAQAARLFFVAGFGPVYLRLLSGRPDRFDALHFLHGRSTQSYLEAILRRPMGLSLLLYLLALAFALPRLRSREGPELDATAAPHPAWLLPAAFLLGKSAEELALLAGLPLAAAAWRRRLPARWLAAWLLAAGAGLAFSGVIGAMAHPSSLHLAPRLSLAWPPTFPQADFNGGGVVVWSGGAVWTWLAELGPLFFAGLALCWRDERRRAAILPFAAGLALATLLSLGGWPKSDADRFLFYGTATGFMLSAVLLERLRGRAAAGAVVALTLLGPVGYAVNEMGLAYLGRPLNRLPSPAITDGLRSALAAVGPRESVLADARHAQWLALSGFVTAAPMTSSMIGQVTLSDAQAYAADPDRRPPDWLLLPPAHPLVAGRPAAGSFGGCVLARAPRDLSPADVAAVLEPSSAAPAPKGVWPPCL